MHLEIAYFSRPVRVTVLDDVVHTHIGAASWATETSEKVLFIGIVLFIAITEDRY